MLTVLPMKDGKIQLEGAIDGTQDLSVLLSAFPPGSIFDCEGVSQINSTGIKAWMRFFCAPERKDFEFKFARMSIPLVEQLNMFRNFIGDGKVMSMAVPFRCEACNFNFNQVFDIGEAVRFKSDRAVAVCGQCGGPAKFDDLPDEYFGFLER